MRYVVEIDDSESVANTTSDASGKDITNEIEVDSSEVKIFGIEELVPSSTPITIPYLEVYRTNELEYVPYLSPYNVGIQSSDSESDDIGTEESDESTEEENSDDSSETEQ